MNNQKIALNYIEATKAQAEAEDRVSQALQILGSDNQILSLAEPIFRAYTALVQEILGPEAWDWLMWWMYETDSGTKPMCFYIDNVEYDPSQLTFQQFWTVVCE